MPLPMAASISGGLYGSAAVGVNCDTQGVEVTCLKEAHAELCSGNSCYSSHASERTAQ